MNIAPNWIFAAGLLAVGIAGGSFVTHGIMESRIEKLNASHAEELRVREVQRAKDEAASRAKEQTLTAQIATIEQGHSDEVARIRSSYDASIAGLQNRPNRKPANPSIPAPATTTCQGSTGAELSRPDAVFLSGEATRADELRSALSACYQAYDSIAR